MKTVKVEFPIQEVVEILRLLRAESQCLIDQTEFMPDADINRRVQNVLSARERFCTSLEGVADTEDVILDPSQIAMHIEPPARSGNTLDRILGDAVAVASGEGVTPILDRHAVLPNEFNRITSYPRNIDTDDWDYWNKEESDWIGRSEPAKAAISKGVPVRTPINQSEK